MEASPGPQGNLSPSCPAPPPCIWWSKECDALVSLRKQKLQRFLHTGETEDYEAYRLQCVKTRKGLKKIKIEEFKKFANSLKRDTNPNEVWKIMKRFNSRWNRTETDRAVPDEKIENVRAQIEDLFPPWTPPPPPNHLLTSPGRDLFLYLVFLPEELEWALNSVNIGSCPGLDGVDYKMIKEFSPLGRAFLLNLYNLFYEDGIFPEEWREYLVLFIPKQGSSNKFRPISLSSCLCKVMERLITNRLMWWLENNKLIPRSQYGFRKQRSCLDNLTLLYTDNLISTKNDLYPQPSWMLRQHMIQYSPIYSLVFCLH